MCAVLAGPAFAQPETGSAAQPAPAPAPAVEPVPAPAPPPPLAPVPAPPPEAPAPSISHTDVVLIGASGAGLGMSLVMFLAARDSSADADLAARYDDHASLQARSTRLYIGSGVIGATAVALGVFEYMRIHRSRERTGIAIAPHRGGGSLVIGGSW